MKSNRIMQSKVYRFLDYLLRLILLNTAALLMLTPLLIGYLFVQRLFIEGVERSGIVG